MKKKKQEREKERKKKHETQPKYEDSENIQHPLSCYTLLLSRLKLNKKMQGIYYGATEEDSSLSFTISHSFILRYCLFGTGIAAAQTLAGIS